MSDTFANIFNITCNVSAEDERVGLDKEVLFSVRIMLDG
jgi:hypothetical protein